MVRACQYATGANPLNLCFTTGLAKETPEHVFIGDAILTNQPTPPGITPLGPQEWMLLNNVVAEPACAGVPGAEGLANLREVYRCRLVHVHGRADDP